MNRVLVVCAWCNLVLRGVDAQPPILISHGICQGCKQKLVEISKEEDLRCFTYD